MTVERKPPSGLLKLGFKIPMWFYRLKIIASYGTIATKSHVIR